MLRSTPASREQAGEGGPGRRAHSSGACASRRSASTPALRSALQSSARTCSYPPSLRASTRTVRLAVVFEARTSAQAPGSIPRTVGARAVDRGDRIVALERRADLRGERELPLIGAGQLHLRRGAPHGNLVQLFLERVCLAGQPAGADQRNPAGRANRVVGDVRRPAETLEIVAAGLAAEVDPRRPHRVLAQRMAHGPEQRRAAAAANVLNHRLRDLYIDMNPRARMTLEVIAGQQREHAVGRRPPPAPVDQTETVAVAVPGEAEIGPEPPHEPAQRLHMLRVLRVGGVRGRCIEPAVDHLHARAAGPQRGGAGQRADPVAGVGGDRQRRCAAAGCGEVGQVVGDGVPGSERAAAACVVAALDQRANLLNLIRQQRQGGRLEQLDAVLVGWIVRRGHDRGAGWALRRAAPRSRPVDQRRRRETDLDHVDAGGAEAVDQRRAERGRARALVAAHHALRRVPAAPQHRAVSAPDRLGERRRQQRPAALRRAADVVGAKDLPRYAHSRRSRSGRQTAAQPTRAQTERRIDRQAGAVEEGTGERRLRRARATRGRRGGAAAAARSWAGRRCARARRRRGALRARPAAVPGCADTRPRCRPRSAG